MTQARPDRTDLTDPKTTLLCHALEVLLKGWLAHNGQYSINALKNQFGHDLVKLVDKVLTLYGASVSFPAELKQIAAAVNPFYKDASYEYPVQGKPLTHIDSAVFERVVTDCKDMLIAHIR